ncbi:MAG: hypothetical protein OXE73_00560 [Gammaproteobacteria bacterium]|nr:hypothetical protein [Gammaproteobacteria bacterium]
MRSSVASMSCLALRASVAGCPVAGIAVSAEAGRKYMTRGLRDEDPSGT